MKHWTLTALYSAMNEDLKLCHTELELSMCRTVCEKEIRDLAKTLTRKLTPGEISVLENIGI